MDFDETRLYYTHQQLQAVDPDNDDDNDRHHPYLVNADDDNDTDCDLKAVRRHFREFLRNYQLGHSRYVYRDKLLRMHRRIGVAQLHTKLVVDLAHLGEYDPSLLGYLLNRPAQILPVLEQAALDALKTLLYDKRSLSTTATETIDDTINDNSNLLELLDQVHVQVLLQGSLKPTPLRSIHSNHVDKLLKCPGIVISTTPIRHRAVQITVRCHTCLETRVVDGRNLGPFANLPLPNKCNGPDCKADPFIVVPDESRFIDQQRLKLQEAPEQVPTGEMPRSVLVAVERSLVDVAPPGTRVSLLCIPTLMSVNGSYKTNKNKQGDGGKSIYLRVVGLQKDNDAHGPSVAFTPAERQAFQALAARSDVYDILQRSIAPNLRGRYTVDIKKALTCQLFSGSSKRLPDGVKLRGDINVLLLGDPSMAKSQFLKFISNVAPVGIYSSGKGSSAAGLTASVVRDAKGEFYLEGGAMVLADGGVVCIDEFDKMRSADRVAIHEAMEQQTISIAKAGITTVLNSRSSVLAAANPVFGRYDDFKSASENIDLMTTILSRFDLIFLVRDIREEERDRQICQHVMNVHINSSRRTDRNVGHTQIGDGALSLFGNTGDSIHQGIDDIAKDDSPEEIAEHIMGIAATGQGTLNVSAYKKYIQYCKSRCQPRLSDEAAKILTSSYVSIRDTVRKNHLDDGTPSTIPITVRQLEALVRISESLAKMRMDHEVQSADVTEALRLFQVSTLAANSVDNNTNAMIGGSIQQPELERTEAFLRARLVLGSLVNKQKLVEEAVGRGFQVMVVYKALVVMAGRGELSERHQGRLLKRIK